MADGREQQAVQSRVAVEAGIPLTASFAHMETGLPAPFARSLR
jgi:hypothetical protein